MNLKGQMIMAFCNKVNHWIRARVYNLFIRFWGWMDEESKYRNQKLEER